MIKLNKKAISEVVTSVLLIVLAIAGVSILSVYVFNISSNAPSLSPQISCIEMQKTSALKLTSACFNKETNEIEAIFFLSSEASSVSKADFILSTGTEDVSLSCGKNVCSTCTLPSPGTSARYFFSPANADKINKVSISTNGCFMNSVAIKSC